MRGLRPIACALLLVACTPAKAPQKVAPPPYRMANDIPELMNHVVDPAAKVVWANAGFVIDAKGEHDLWPTTEDGWINVENAAATVTEAGNALMLPGRPRGPTWTGYAQQLADAGIAAKAAAEAKDKDGLFDTGGQIYEACTACHREYLLGEKAPPPK